MESDLLSRVDDFALLTPCFFLGRRRSPPSQRHQVFCSPPGLFFRADDNAPPLFCQLFLLRVTVLLSIALPLE